MSEIFAALIGALVGGAAQTLLIVIERNRKRNSLLRALASEVGTLCEYLRLLDYAASYRAAETLAMAGKPTAMIPIDATRNYFTVFEASAADIGMLDGQQAAVLTRFYTLCKIALDTARPEGVFIRSTGNTLGFMASLAERILELGDEIVQFPVKPAAFRQPA